jgi:PAS domain S-box-containing protein
MHGDRINTMKDNDKTKERLIKELKILLESEDTYRMIFESANDGIIIHDTEGNIFEVNQTMYNKLGYSKQEIIKLSLKGLVAPEYAMKIKERMDLLKKDGVAIFESADRRKDGTVMSVEVSARYINYKGQKLILSLVRDINERKIAEDLIMSTYRENETLIDEIKRQARFYPIDFIKKRLYRSPSLLRIDISGPIKKLVSYSFSLYRVGLKNIQVKREIHDARLDLEKAISCALIINELLSNSLKHAFPDDRKGEIVINLRKAPCGGHILRFHDNGTGFPDKIDFRKTSTLGMQLVMDLVDQLDGEIEMRRNQGTEFIVQF